MGMAAGLSRSRLDRMRRVLSGYIERKEIAGLVALVSHHDDVHVETLGTLSIDQPAPMKRDAIFRIASLSKPITAVAAMMLVEDCKLRLDDSIEPWLPELANRRVLRSMTSEMDDTVPAQRPLTVRDLLTYRTGFGSVMAPPDTYPIQKLIREYKIGGDGPPLPAQAPTTEEWVKRFGSLPLMAQPGERWMYHVSHEVLGVLIARVSGRSLGAFLQERIFDPLGMSSTKFVLRPAEWTRMAEPLPSDSILQLAEKDRRDHPEWESGGGGLVSSIRDYGRFAQMLLNGGEFDGRRYLSPAAFKLMTTDHIGPGSGVGRDYFYFPGDGFGYGYGIGVRTDPGNAKPPPPGSIGELKWDSGSGTYFGIDPKLDVVYIMMEQSQPERGRITPAFKKLVYDAFGQ